MTLYKRLVVQVHHIDADKPQQAAEILAARLRALRTALGPQNARVLIINADSSHDGLDDLLAGLCAPDEIDDNPERNPRPGYVPVEDTDLRERLLAWRAAAAQAAHTPAGDLAATFARLILGEVGAALGGSSLSRTRSLRRIWYDATALLAALDGQGGPGGPECKPVLTDDPTPAACWDEPLPEATP